MLEVSNVDVYYDDFHVIHGASLQVAQGEFVGIAGANGHGKSTLLKAICGLTGYKSGTIEFCGVSTATKSTAVLVAEGLVYVPEERHLFQDMTVHENLRLGAFLESNGRDVSNNFEKVYTLYPRLKEREHQLAGTLSGGEAQMLALGRGLMSSAKLLAIDEPSLGLAPRLANEMLDTLVEINKGGVTILLVEQSLELIQRMVSRVYRIEEGKVMLSA